MGKIDPAKERARLAALYSEMSELELQKSGANPEALTEWARAAFLEEMRKRGLVWKREPQAKPISDEEILIRLREYPERNSAGVDQDFLARVAGIACFLYDDSLVRLDWFISNAIGGVKLVVSQNTAEEADRILSAATEGSQGGGAQG